MRYGLYRKCATMPPDLLVTALAVDALDKDPTGAESLLYEP